MGTISLMGGILPPKRGDIEGNNRWQWMVFLKLWMLLAFAFWALDLMPGFPGLARADEMRQLGEEIRRARVEVIESQLFELRIKQCLAETPVTRQAYGEQLAKAMRSFYELTGARYELLNCADIR